jgi:predicted AlkP superfamily phosphohydrolase/phosphomutase
MPPVFFILPAFVAVPAYIGPGAGFVLGGSFLFALAGILLAFLALLAWPVRVVIRSLRGRGRMKNAKVRRVVVLGLDGLDPVIVRKMSDEGQLPNLDRLKEEGGFRPLGTTWPAMSPVGWSTFATGVDPSGHNIFDFLSRDKVTHLPVLSSTRLNAHPAKKIGPLTLPGGGHKFELLKRSKPFWKTCAEAGVESSILRIPITFPPDKFGGKMLSAMCVPDLRGTQGTFSHFTEPGQREESGRTTGGVRTDLEPEGENKWTACLLGPDNPDGTGGMESLITVTVDKPAAKATFTLAGQTFTLRANEFSDWIPVSFGKGTRKAHGICKIRITGFEPGFSFYVSPLHIDPRKPAMPISNPPHYAIALSRLQGRFATLGLAEDTWALNERVLDEQAFLDQAYGIHEERKAHFFHALARQPEGVVSVVFDATDRIQHMFFRYLDPEHPANRDKDTEIHKDAIFDLYRKADELVGETQARMGDNDALLIVSDHGFKSFQRGVNLNSWFRENGFLYLKSDPENGPLPVIPEGNRHEVEDIDWPRTRAYTNGLAGYYLNIKGREKDGCVDPDQALALKYEINDKLRGLPDAACGSEAITELWASEDIYHGPYRENGPDVIVGYKPGYRTDWDAAVGAVSGTVLSDNTRSWSGDHCMDPRQVPGVLFSSVPFAATRPNLVDMAPSVLDLLGLAAPGHMTGRSIFRDDEQVPAQEAAS